jgi:ABC-type uncharacterized transport system permease subunit
VSLLFARAALGPALQSVGIAQAIFHAAPYVLTLIILT